MNKILLLCVCLILCVGMLVGCGEAASRAQCHVITPSGKTLSIGDNGDGITDKLGEPKAYAEAQSCYGVGMDKVYTYSGFEVTTYPSEDGSRSFISVLALTEDTVQTDKGLQVGMTFAEATELYGDQYVQRGNAAVYTIEDGIILWIDLDEDVITRIEFRAP